jgi:hypothetical protein
MMRPTLVRQECEPRATKEEHRGRTGLEDHHSALAECAVYWDEGQQGKAEDGREGDVHDASVFIPAIVAT